MIKGITLGLLAIIGLSVSLWNVNRVDAQVAASYTWEYDNQNFYRDYGITYYMTGLTSGAEYRWTYSLLDNSGLVIDVIAERSLVATGVTETVNISRDTFPANTFGPVRVTDNYGNTLATHFLADEFPNFPGTFEWEQSNGNTAENEKQSPGALYSSGPCIAPPYNETLNNGWQHTGRSCSVATTPGGYLLLHYRMDLADYGTGDTIQFQLIEPETLDVFVVDIDEMVDYNASGRTGPILGSSLGSQQTHNFVVLNTSGSTPPFIDPVISNLAFTSGQNPHRASFDPGAYTCTREDSVGTWVSDCESLFLVSNAPDGNEWRLTFNRGSVAPNELQTARFVENTTQVVSAYQGGSNFTDSEVGLIDLTVYPFSANRSLVYNVAVADAAAGNTAVGSWTVFPATLPTDLMNPDQAFFTAVSPITSELPTYLVADPNDFATGLAGIFEQTGFDTPAGQMMVVLVLTVLGSGAMWFFHFPSIVYSIWYLFTGGFVLFVTFSVGVTSGLFAILYVASVPLVIIFGIMGQNSGSGGSEFA